MKAVLYGDGCQPVRNSTAVIQVPLIQEQELLYCNGLQVTAIYLTSRHYFNPDKTTADAAIDSLELGLVK